MEHHGGGILFRVLSCLRFGVIRTHLFDIREAMIEKLMADNDFLLVRNCSCGPEGKQKRYKKRGGQYPKVNYYIRKGLWKVWHSAGNTQQGKANDIEGLKACLGL